MDSVQPSLFMKAASIGKSDLWVLAAMSGAIRLAPIHMLSTLDARTLPEESVLLNLIELGNFDRDGARKTSTGLPIPPRSGAVLLLPWSAVPTLARLDALARRSPCDGRAPDGEWLTTWHHFVDTDSAPSSVVGSTMTRRAHALDVHLSPGPRRYVFGTVCGDRQCQMADGPEMVSGTSSGIRNDDRHFASIRREPSDSDMVTSIP
jgi:hypothetical protein